MIELKLSGIKPGLIVISYPHEIQSEQQVQELAFKIHTPLGEALNLANSALYYRDYLRDGMKRAIRGFAPYGLFAGYKFWIMLLIG